jgi:hypothetical protein
MHYPKDKIQPDKKYYSMTFSASDDGKIMLGGSQTMWVGYADVERKIELRQFSLVKPDRMADFWIEFGMPFCVVNDVDDFAKWFISGGHALVEKDIATLLLPHSLEPSSCVQLGNRGFSGISILPQTIFKKAPSPQKENGNFKKR